MMRDDAMLLLALLILLGQFLMLLALLRLVRTFGQYARHAELTHETSVALLEVVRKERQAHARKEVA